MLTDLHVVYLHGFRSSPKSEKAQLMQYFVDQIGGLWPIDGLQQESIDNQPMPEHQLKVHLHIPKLSIDIEKTSDVIEKLIQKIQVDAGSQGKLAFIGSSLGGYFATKLGQKYHAPAVLINPAVKPYEKLKEHLGPQKGFHDDEVVVVTESAIEALAQWEVSIEHPERYFLLQQTKDEVLSYQEAVQKYQNAKCWIQSGGSHGFDHFNQIIPSIFYFIEEFYFPWTEAQ